MLSPLSSPHFRLATAWLALATLNPTGCATPESPPTAVAPVSAAAAAPATLDPLAFERCTLVAREGAPAIAEHLHVSAEGVVSATGQPVGYLATRESYSDFELTLDWRWTGKPGNSGVLVALGEPAADKVWPRCVQLQLKAGAAGELIPMEGFPSAELKPGAKSVPRAADVTELPPGEWNTCRVVVHGESVECWINGTAACRITQCGSTAGRIGLQLEGAPFEYRHVALKRL